MRCRPYLSEWITEAAGSSLVEAVVALSLLLTVLVPLSVVVVQWSLDRRNRHEIEALALAQRVMEEALHRQAYTSAVSGTARDVWRTEREVAREGGRVAVTVRVYRKGRVRPIVELVTVRLL